MPRIGSNGQIPGMQNLKDCFSILGFRGLMLNPSNAEFPELTWMDKSQECRISGINLEKQIPGM